MPSSRPAVPVVPSLSHHPPALPSLMCHPCPAILLPCHPCRAILTMPFLPHYPCCAIVPSKPQVLPALACYCGSPAGSPQQPPSCRDAQGRSSRFIRKRHHQPPKVAWMAQKGHPWDAQRSLARRPVLNMSHGSITLVHPMRETSRHPFSPQTLEKHGPSDDAKCPVLPPPSPRQG